jgi:hypothetical protein
VTTAGRINGEDPATVGSDCRAIRNPLRLASTRVATTVRRILIVDDGKTDPDGNERVIISSEAAHTISYLMIVVHSTIPPGLASVRQIVMPGAYHNARTMEIASSSR